MKIGLIGNDTSHVEVFANLLHNREHAFYLGGAEFAGYIECHSDDMQLSRERAPHFKEVLNRFGIKRYETIDELDRSVDAWLIVGVDGTRHLEWFSRIVHFQKPVFIDKPVAASLADFDQMTSLSEKWNTPLFSSSSLRFSVDVQAVKNEEIDFLYAYGPLPFQEKMPGYYWYGIHSLEWIDELFNSDVASVERVKLEEYELVHFVFTDGRRAVFRGEYEWKDKFGGTAHIQGKPVHLDLWKMEKPYYVSLLEEMICFFRTGESPVPPGRTRRILEWIEALNRL